jgi:hypothetical protein
MKKKFYICGTRPVIREIHNDYEEYFSFQWETGQFKQDMQYMENIYFDSSGDVKEVSETEFNTYVEKLKNEKEL